MYCVVLPMTRTWSTHYCVTVTVYVGITYYLFSVFFSFFLKNNNQNPMTFILHLAVSFGEISVQISSRAIKCKKIERSQTNQIFAAYNHHFKLFLLIRLKKTLFSIQTHTQNTNGSKLPMSVMIFHFGYICMHLFLFKTWNFVSHEISKQNHIFWKISRLVMPIFPFFSKYGKLMQENKSQIICDYFLRMCEVVVVCDIIWQWKGNNKWSCFASVFCFEKQKLVN